GIGRHRRARHRLHTARDGEVVVAGLHARGREVHRLLGRPALAIDSRGRHLPRQPGRDPCVAGDVAALLAGLADAAPDHVVDPVIPAVPRPFASEAAELLDEAFTFAEKLLHNSHEFVGRLLDAADNTSATASAKPAATTSSSSTAKASAK